MRDALPLLTGRPDRPARTIGVTVAAAALLTLSACAGPRTVSHVSSQNDVFNYVITSSLPLDVIGNPFSGAPDAVVAAATAQGMSGNVNGRSLTFIPTMETDGPEHPGYRTVVFVSGGGVVPGPELCAGTVTAETVKGGTLHASAALCDGAEMVAWAEGWGGPVPAMPDSGYAALMNQLADAVFKRERDYDRDGNDGWPG
ncbi:hypothetical protein F1188_08005 [Roseospira marina]|uniref:Uncharacterized protein n=1 Tax=Roseospira marina TaxID=140057 RepID=A0A5M6IDC4_9PROT|nr:hypothetical protein [Roseospira marina]KAA5605957.1 hypothetical protein F1188_08005 [Roseospira marina]MBB4313197.1 hypothetical protein [Roseospira marina]MBB5086062.1 hypothetical protein [Roseospira marina]